MKQILEARGPDNELTVNGVALQQVTLVGQLSQVDTQVTVMKMRLDDGSGAIECSHMLPPDEDANPDAGMHRRQLLRDGTWARVVGRVMVAGGARQLEAFMLRPLADHNELTYHRLDVVRTFLAQTRPRKRAGPVNATAMQGVTNGAPPAVGADGLNLNPVSRAVYEYAKQRHESNKNSDEISISVADVVRDVPQCGSHANAKSILDQLASDGYVYTTIDDDHFAFCQM